MGLKDRVRRAERAASGDMVLVPQLDGTTARFPQHALWEAVRVDHQRGRAHRLGALDTAPPAHPFTVALMNATPDGLEALLAKEGWGWARLAAEEEIRAGRACS